MYRSICALSSTDTDPPEPAPATLEPGEVVDDGSLRGQVRAWLDPAPRTPHAGLALGRLIAREVRRVGRHLLPGALLAELDEVARLHHGRDAFLDAFLDAVLARHRDGFRNQTYLALPLLDRITADPAAGLDPEGLSALLMADLIAHEELHAADPRARTRRVRHAERFVTEVHRASATDTGMPHPESLAGAWLALTALPVSTVHDEYFFIRCLQAHEQVFTTLTEHLLAATAAVRAGAVDDATRAVEHAVTVFERAALLFRIVATMDPDAFHAFRQFTDGASAIQSEAYKRFELACGRPGAERLHSEAFTHVPAVRAGAGGQDDLTAALRDHRRREGVPGHARLRLERAIARLESDHQRWKTTHHSLARRMLGEAPGSGHTAGVPYLRACLDNRLFTAAGAGGHRGTSRPTTPRPIHSP